MVKTAMSGKSERGEDEEAPDLGPGGEMARIELIISYGRPKLETEREVYALKRIVWWLPPSHWRLSNEPAGLDCLLKESKLFNVPPFWGEISMLILRDGFKVSKGSIYR